MKIAAFILLLAAGIHADYSIPLDQYKSDYLCYFIGANGVEADSGYAFTLWEDASVSVRFVEGNAVEFGVDCDLDIFPPDPNTLVLQCSFLFSSQASMTFTMDKSSLRGHASMMGEKPESRDLICRPNRR
jgi:hypothetical protein